MSQSSAIDQLRMELTSSFEHLDDVVEQSEAFVSQYISDPEKCYNAVLLVSEAVTNAIEHGNGLDESKMVILELKAEDDRIRMMVQDEGVGFERADVADPMASENILEASGRGLYLIEALADEVVYEDDGRRVIASFLRSGE